MSKPLPWVSAFASDTTKYAILLLKKEMILHEQVFSMIESKMQEAILKSLTGLPAEYRLERVRKVDALPAPRDD